LRDQRSLGSSTLRPQQSRSALPVKLHAYELKIGVIKRKTRFAKPTRKEEDIASSRLEMLVAGGITDLKT
jgi:hypothetical protein